MSIVISNLVKYFGKQLVVNDLSLEIQDGEFFALLGSSGSGKSTVLRMIAGLTIPDQGRIELNGRDVTNLPPQKREIGMVFQNYAIFRHMTVGDNIEFGLKVRGIAKADRLQRQEELLELVGLSGFGKRFPDQISGGQRQRVALARALAYNPSVLLLDEPFGALDARIRSQLRESVKEIQSSLKITTILVTHDQEEAFELAGRIGVIEKGRIAEIGDAESLYHRPGTSFVATFIGGGNVLVGRCRQNRIHLGNVSLPFPEEAPGHNEGDPVRILFRAENVVIRKDSFPADSGGHLLGQGVLEDQQFTGAHIRSRLRIESLKGARPLSPYPRYGRGFSISSIQPSWQAKPDLKNGDKCWIALSSFHVLNPSGLRIMIKHNREDNDSAAWKFGAMLAAAAHGLAMLVHVCDQDQSVESGKKELETFIGQQPLNPALRLELRVKQGAEVNEILSATQEGFYEVAILDRKKLAPGRWKAFDPLSLALLEEANTPVLLMAEERKELRRILICTAGGEPGKNDIQLGARFARQTGASVTVLHVTRPENSTVQKQRIDRHLEQAKKVLDDLGVESEIVIKSSPALQQIQALAEEGDYDLIVIGAPAPSESQAITFSSQVVSATTRPVLIVPALDL